jgi:hypothetical protein
MLITMAKSNAWPPLKYPIVEGEQAITPEWSIKLPATEKLARRVEDGSLVLWRPGLTVRVGIWNNDRHESQARRLAAAKTAAPARRRDEQESVADGLVRWSYRAKEETDRGMTDLLMASIFSRSDHARIAVYFDDASDATVAQQLVDGVTRRDA